MDLGFWEVGCTPQPNFSGLGEPLQCNVEYIIFLDGTTLLLKYSHEIRSQRNVIKTKSNPDCDFTRKLQTENNLSLECSISFTFFSLEQLTLQLHQQVVKILSYLIIC